MSFLFLELIADWNSLNSSKIFSTTDSDFFQSKPTLETFSCTLYALEIGGKFLEHQTIKIYWFFVF